MFPTDAVRDELKHGHGESTFALKKVLGSLKVSNNMSQT